MTVFVDTSAFIAYLNANDRYHSAAVSQWQALLAGDETLLCNNYILVETMAILQHRFGLGAVRGLQDGMLPLLTIDWIDEAAHATAMAALTVANRRALSLVDCSAMTTMRAWGVNRIFSFDAHYGEYDFTLLPADTSS